MLSTVLTLASELEAADRAVIATDAEGKIIYWGAGAHRLFGWDEAEVHDRNGALAGVIGITRRGGYMAAKRAEGHHH